jgi:hypothetical protein
MRRVRSRVIASVLALLTFASIFFGGFSERANAAVLTDLIGPHFFLATSLFGESAGDLVACNYSTCVAPTTSMDVLVVLEWVTLTKIPGFGIVMGHCIPNESSFWYRTYFSQFTFDPPVFVQIDHASAESFIGCKLI